MIPKEDFTSSSRQITSSLYYLSSAIFLIEEGNYCEDLAYRSKISELIIKYNISGIIVSNTTETNRENLSDINKNEKGGLSGQPLRDRSTKLIKKIYNQTKGKIQIIGVGGVDSGKAAFEKISAGANAVQLYTGMVYRGPRIAAQINNGLIKILEQEGINNINDVVGLKKSTWRLIHEILYKLHYVKKMRTYW